MLKLLGLINRTGKLLSGTDIVLDGIRKGKVNLVFLASDASENTKKLIRDKTTYYNVRLIEDFSSMELSHSIGKKNRMVLGVADLGFSKKLKEMRDLNGK